MPVLKNGAIVDDPWLALDDCDDAPAGGDVIVNLERFKRQRHSLLLREGRLGVRLAPDQEPGELVETLAHLSLIALEFPRFTDGRSYSHARLLRERHGYRGELRAVGQVLRDQLFFMWRCGIDAYELEPGTNLSGALAAFDEISVAYQGGADQPPLFRRR